MRIRKGFAPAIVALIIIVLIAVGYAYAASRSHAVASTSSSPAPTPTTSSTQSPSPSPSPTPSPTSPPVFLPPEEPPGGGGRYAVIVIEGYAYSGQCRGWIVGIGTTTRDWVPAYRRLEGAPYVEVEVVSQSRRKHVTIYFPEVWWRVYVDVTEFSGQWVGVHVKLFVCGNLVDEKYFYRVHIPSI